MEYITAAWNGDILVYLRCGIANIPLVDAATAGSRWRVSCTEESGVSIGTIGTASLTATPT